jgi:osmotically-inducible protein OsmY
LTEDERIDASNIEVTVTDCEITLSGSVSSREEKRRAEDLVAYLRGVRDVHNRLSVVIPENQSSRAAHSWVSAR